MRAEDYAQLIRDQLGDAWLAQIYGRILKLRTRSYHFDLKRKSNQISIQHTLLGIELKVGSKRFACPDLAHARYLAVFARIGSEAVAVPYDITKVSLLADELESSWYRMLLLADEEAKGRPKSFKSRLRGVLVNRLREEISAVGAGAKMPSFEKNTKGKGKAVKPLQQNK
jgi:hypothetical protein